MARSASGKAKSARGSDRQVPVSVAPPPPRRSRAGSSAGSAADVDGRSHRTKAFFTETMAKPCTVCKKKLIRGQERYKTLLCHGDCGRQDRRVVHQQDVAVRKARVNVNRAGSGVILKLINPINNKNPIKNPIHKTNQINNMQLINKSN